MLMLMMGRIVGWEELISEISCVRHILFYKRAAKYGQAGSVKLRVGGGKGSSKSFGRRADFSASKAGGESRSF